MINGLQNKVLFVDDDPDDLEFFGETLKKVNPHITIVEEYSGPKALEYLYKAKENGTLPCLIVMDFNMPVMNGRETFQEIKKDEELAVIPIIIFSTATSHIDEQYFTAEGVEHYKKPSSYNEMHAIALHILRYCR
ncbi:MAG TPA: response regulator [Flavisolibacter sp.]|nr:response regulator [Flavisolibacter sp.]